MWLQRSAVDALKYLAKVPEEGEWLQGGPLSEAAKSQTDGFRFALASPSSGCLRHVHCTAHLMAATVIARYWSLGLDGICVSILRCPFRVRSLLRVFF